MERAEIDGVTVVWEQADGPLRADLVFACGHRDEQLETQGLTDLLQNLVDPEGTTIHFSTTFETTGTPEQVCDYLARVCRDLSALPLERLEETAARLDPLFRAAVQSFFAKHLYPFSSLLSRRFGAHGVGLTRWPPLDYGQFTGDQLSAHAARYFTRGNAVLVLTGPPPPGLRLPLPLGPRNVHEPFYRQPHGPIWYCDEVIGVGIAMSAEADAVSRATLWLLIDRLDAALEQAGPGYTHALEVRAVGPESCELGIVLQPIFHLGRRKPRRDSPAAAQRAAELVVAALRQLAQDGPTRAELDTLISDVTTQPGIEYTGPMAQQELFGVSENLTAADFVKLHQVQPHEVRSAAASWLRTALVVVPRGVQPDLPGFAQECCPTGTHVPDGEVFKPSLLDRIRGRASSLEYLVLHQSGVFTVDAAEAVHAAPTADLVVMLQGHRVWLGNLSHQCQTEISGYGRVCDIIWQAAAPQRRRQAF